LHCIEIRGSIALFIRLLDRQVSALLPVCLRSRIVLQRHQTLDDVNSQRCDVTTDPLVQCRVIGDVKSGIIVLKFVQLDEDLGQSLENNGILELRMHMK